MKDTINLRENADFEVSVGKNILWVPYNLLGKSKWTNDDLREIDNLKVDEIQKCITVPYEIAQFVQVNQYKRNVDIKFVYLSGRKWEIHRSGKAVLNNKNGCCSTYASLFNFLLSDNFSDIYNLCIVANDGWGHAMNYIKLNGYCYFFDISAQICDYIKFIPKETGNKADFATRKILTGCCLKSITVEDFINFFMKYQRFDHNKRSFVFYSTKTKSIPPICILKKELYTKVYMKEKDSLSIHYITGNKIQLDLL